MQRANPGSFLVRLQDIAVRKNGRWLIRHVSFDVLPGEILTIVGPNGSGKSTTLKALTGLVKPDEGNIKRADNLTIGYLPQSLTLNSTMPLSVRAMMRLGADFTNDKITELLDRFQISHLLNEQVHALSGGELQRLLLARAIIAEPELLVLDEPCQGVDITGQMEIYDFIRQYRDDTGAGVVLVSHDLHLVMAATDRVICLNGHICCSGTPETVAANPQYLELFGPKAANALAFYRHSHDHQHLADGRVQHADGSISDNCHPDDGHHHES